MLVEGSIALAGLGAVGGAIFEGSVAAEKAYIQGKDAVQIIAETAKGAALGGAGGAVAGAALPWVAGPAIAGGAGAILGNAIGGGIDRVARQDNTTAMHHVGHGDPVGHGLAAAKPAPAHRGKA